jgi:hypothetical protein
MLVSLAVAVAVALVRSILRLSWGIITWTAISMRRLRLPTVLLLILRLFGVPLGVALGVPLGVALRVARMAL